MAAMGPQSPEGAARARYAASFSSSIFAPPDAPQGPAFIPAGKRRDQTTSEMFGSYAEKDLKGQPLTFMPKEDLLSARQKKQIFLSSGVLPGPNFPAGMQQMEQQPVPGYGSAPAPEEDDDAVDTSLRRQQELQSKLFGRSTPNIDAGQLHDRSNRLTPNDFTWHSHPEPVQGGVQEMSHDQRAYREKCSAIFNHQSPQVHQDHLDSRRVAKQEENEGDAKRRSNVYYSDLFGRSTPGMDVPKENQGARRCKYQGNPEDKIVVHQDWTDSKTELLHGAHTDRPETPYLRKSDEFNKARIFGATGDAFCPPEKLDPVSHDNSQKLKSAIGMGTQQIHQAHLRSSVTPDHFYQEAENTKHWEVVELHISGLATDADDGYVRKLCQGFDLQLVKVATEVDPVRNLCKGRAKVMVRYNPKRESVAGLVQKLEESRLRVEL